MNWVEVGRYLIVAGATLVVVGILFLYADKLHLGKLPGDLRIGIKQFSVHIPIATCILVSVVLTIVINFFIKK